MKLFPKEQIILTTVLSQDSVLQRISNSIEVEKDFKLFSSTNGKKAFQGMVSLNNFTMKRNLTYRNSFLPITFGQVYSTSTGSQIILTIKMGKFQFFAFVTWTILLGIFSVYSLFILLMEILYSGQLAGWTLVGPIMFLVGYFYVITNFKKEMISTKRFLSTLVNPKEI
jgi:hypothetical protein